MLDGPHWACINPCISVSEFVLMLDKIRGLVAATGTANLPADPTGTLGASKVWHVVMRSDFAYACLACNKVHSAR